MNLSISGIFSWLNTETVPPSLWLSIVCLVVGGALAAEKYVWKVFLPLATWFHEMGHATVALFTGGTVRKVKIFKDGSGVTEHLTRGGVRAALTSFAGYPTPSVAGALIVFFIMGGQTHMVVAVFLFVVAVSLVFVGNLRMFSWTLVIAAVPLSIFVLPMSIMQPVLLIFSGFLIISAPRTIYELRLYRRQAKKLTEKTGEEVHSDADSLAGLTGIPAVVWEIFFTISAVALPVFILWTSAKS